MSAVKTFAEADEKLIERIIVKVSGNGIYGLFGIKDAAREMAAEKNKLIRELAELVLKLCTFPTQDEYKIAQELLKRLGIEQEFQGGYDFSNLDLISKKE